MGLISGHPRGSKWRGFREGAGARGVMRFLTYLKLNGNPVHLSLASVDRILVFEKKKIGSHWTLSGSHGWRDRQTFAFVLNKYLNFSHLN